MWIGDFVRGHTVVRVLKQRWPNRPVDVLVTSLCAPLVDYMPGVRSGIVWDLPRSRLAVAKQWGLATDLRAAGLRHRAGAAPHLEIGDRAGAGRHSRAGRLCRRSPVRAAQPLALGREGAAPLHRQERRTGAARRGAAAAGMAGAAAQGSRRGGRAAGGRPTGSAPVPRSRWRPARSARPSAGPIIRKPRQLSGRTAASMSGWSAAPARRRWRRRSSPPAAPRVRDLTGADLRNGILAMAAAKRRDIEQFRPDAYRGGARHADHGHFRSDQPLSLGAAERPRRDGADQDRTCLPALPAHRSAP